MKNGKKLNEILTNSRRILLVVAFGVILYEVLEHLGPVSKAVKDFFGILQPLFIGVVIAFLASMPLNFLENRVFKRWTTRYVRIKRPICATLAFLFVFAIVTAVIFLIVPNFISSVGSLADGFDSYLSSMRSWADNMWQRVNLSPDAEEKIRQYGMEFLSGFDDVLSNLMSTAVAMTMSVISFVTSLLVAIIIGFYALYNKEKLIFGCKKFIIAAMSEERAARTLDICERTYKSLHDYFFGMILECSILGLMTYIMMLIFGFPYALLISVIVGVTQIVPIIGPWVSAALGVLIIFVTDPPSAIWFAIGVFAVQQLEANLVYPRVVGRAVGLSGIWVLIAIILGGGLFGFVGIVLCVPIMAVIYTMVSEWINRRVEEKRFEKGMRDAPPTDDEIKDMTEP